MMPKFKYVFLFSVAVIGAFSVAAISRATYQTIGDIPEADSRPHLRLKLDGTGFEQNAEYMLSFDGINNIIITANDMGEFDTVQVLPNQILKSGRFHFNLEQKQNDHLAAPELNVSVDMNKGAMTWGGKAFGGARDIKIAYPSVENNAPVNAATKSDWSGRFEYIHPVKAEISAENRYCMTSEAAEDKKALNLCVSFSIKNAPLLTQVLTPAPSFLSLLPNIGGDDDEEDDEDGNGIGISFGSDDPLSPFAEWTEPVNCIPYFTPLSTCNEAHMNELFEAGTTMVFDLMTMTRQLSAIMMQQVGLIGTLMDAKFQLETQLLLWKRQEEAYNDYFPSEQMCTLTTMTKELAIAEEKSRVNSYALAKLFSYTDDNPTFSFTEWGSTRAYRIRLNEYRQKYCNPSEMNYTLQSFCDGLSEANMAYLNRDLNYAETLEIPRTLNVDFTDNENPSADEENVFALGRNLFGGKTINWKQPGDENEGNAATFMNDPKLVHLYQEYRSLTAMRNAARESYNAIVGMKGKGAGYVAPHIMALMEQLGIPDEDMDRFLGENPSYFAQMEVLTKHIYQSPDFYTNLMTSPTNVSRFKVILAAISSLSDWDSYLADRREEIGWTIKVELQLRKLQLEIDGDLARASKNEL